MPENIDAPGPRNEIVKLPVKPPENIQQEGIKNQDRSRGMVSETKAARGLAIALEQIRGITGAEVTIDHVARKVKGEGQPEKVEPDVRILAPQGTRETDLLGNVKRGGSVAESRHIQPEKPGKDFVSAITTEGLDIIRGDNPQANREIDLGEGDQLRETRRMIGDDEYVLASARFVNGDRVNEIFTLTVIHPDQRKEVYGTLGRVGESLSSEDFFYGETDPSSSSKIRYTAGKGASNKKDEFRQRMAAFTGEVKKEAKALPKAA